MVFKSTVMSDMNTNNDAICMETETMQKDVVSDEIIVNLETKAEILKEQLTKNIDLAMERNYDLEKLAEVAEDCSGKASEFEKKGRHIKRQKFVQLLQSKITLAVLLMV